ncbi:MAG: hypothetical protein D6737_06830 [Chloroflexi bacterium]|nr:MAG: hypothetical protein D6737_06830 [Chloroflexota bacterium]
MPTPPAESVSNIQAFTPQVNALSTAAPTDTGVLPLEGEWQLTIGTQRFIGDCPADDAAFAFEAGIFLLDVRENGDRVRIRGPFGLFQLLHRPDGSYVATDVRGAVSTTLTMRFTQRAGNGLHVITTRNCEMTRFIAAEFLES